MRLVALVALVMLLACPSGDDDDLVLPPSVANDDDVADDDDTPDFQNCGAPDAAEAYLSPGYFDLIGMVPDPDARALGWALDVANFRFDEVLTDGLELSLFAYVEGECPARSLASDAPVADEACTAVDRSTRATSTWTGGCSGGCEFAMEGEANFALRRLNCTTAAGALTEWEKTASGGFSVGALPRHLGGVSRFGFDGDLRFLHREVASAGPVEVSEEWSVITDFVAIPGPPKGFLSDLWRLGTGSADYAGTASAVYLGAKAERIRRTAAGTVTTGAILPPWKAEFDLRWDSTVCNAEPVEGTVRGVRLVSADDPTELTWASLEFDGATQCDGCGTVYSGALAVGEFCAAPPPSPPPLD